MIAAVCVVAVPSADAADVDYGTETEIDQTAFNGLVSDGAITLTGNTTWVLTGNVTASDVSIVLGDYNLKITNAEGSSYSLSITYRGTAGTAAGSTAAAIVAGTGNPNLCVENVNLTVDDAATDASWTINSSGATAFNLYIVNSDVTISKSAEYIDGMGAVWQTGTGNTTITADEDSKLTFSSNGQGVQSMLINATGTEINNYLGDGTLSIYADFEDVTLSGGNIGFYAADLVNSTVRTTGTVGIYCGSSSSAFTGATDLTMKTVALDADSSLSARTIVNALSASGLASGDAATISGDGTVTGNFEAAGTSAAPTFTLDGVTLAGSNTVRTGVTVDGAYTVSEGATLTAAEGATISGTVTNNGTINASDDSTDFDLAAGGTGTVMKGDSYSTATLSGEVNPAPGGTVFGSTQIVDVTSNLTILSGAAVVIHGTLNIPSGVTVTIQDGAQLIISGVGATLNNEGTIISQSVANVLGEPQKDGGLLVDANTILNNDGTITISGTATGTAVRLGGTINNNGDITIAAGYIAALRDTVVNNNAGASITVDGTLNFGSSRIVNAGNVVINGTVNVYGSGTIAMASTDATVTVTSITSTTGSLLIDNSALTTGVDGKDFANAASGISIGATSTYALSGLTVTSVTDSTGSGSSAQYYRYLAINGTIANSGSTSTTITLTLSGPDAVITDSMVVGTRITFAGTALTVSGTATIAGTAVTVNEVTVTGTLNTGAAALGSLTTINAVHYTVTDATTAAITHVYTNLANAISAGATAIDILGGVEVEGTVTIPSGTTVTLADDAEMTITDEGSVTVADGGKLDTTNGSVQVDGSLYAEVKSTGIAGDANIVSEVMSTDGTDVLYTSLANAMEGAVSGDVITLNGNVLIDEPFTIKEGVTVDTNGKDFTVGSALTIDGTLLLDSGDYTVDAEDGSIVLNGYIKSEDPMIYNGTSYPAGAYYTATEGTTTYNYITTPANAVASIADASEQTVSLYGTNRVENLTVTGTATAPATVNVYGTLEGDVALTYATVDVMTNGTVSGTVSDADGSVRISGASYNGVDFISDADGLRVEGTISKAQDSMSMTVEGTVSANRLTVPVIIVTGTLDVTGNMTVTESMTVEGTVNVNGRLTVTNSASDAQLVVTGTVDAANGSASADNLYAGILSSDITAGADAVVSGNVTATVAYVSAGSTVPESIAGSSATSVTSTEFYVEDALWMTVYGSATVSVTKAPVVNAVFNGWNNADGDMIYPLTGTGTTASSITVGTPDKLYAEIDANIYALVVTADNGIGSVYVDGQALAKYSNLFYITGLAAGQHTITWEMKNGYEGTVEMTVNGTAATGGAITLSGTDVGNYRMDVGGVDMADYMVYQINLTGTVAGTTGGSSSGSSDGLGLTDILLIILVVLIVIMAIMVAMRLMRS